jgi:dehydrogenase/reductase SDR family member 12
MILNGIVDAFIEAPIVTSFTRLGFEARRRLADWTSLDDYDLTGRVIVVTGATSGLGYAAAEQLARCGATLVVVGRTDERNERTVAELMTTTGNASITQVPADMGDLDQVRHLAQRVLADHDRLDVLIHNAGALDAERRVAPDGTEATVASQVVGPFLLTGLLLDRLLRLPRHAC